MKQNRIIALLCTASLVGSLVGCATQETTTVVEPQTETVETTVEEPVDATVESTVEESVETTVETTVEAQVEQDTTVAETTTESTQAETTPEVAVETDVVESEVMLDTDLWAVPLASTPAISTVAMPVASGVTVYANTKINIDASNTADGYVMIKVIESTTAAHKVIVTGPSGTPYYYNLTTSGEYEVFPLSDGNGSYLIQVCKNVTGTSYSVSHSTTLNVSLTDQFAPFLLPNQYVNYSASSTIVSKAASLMTGKTTELEKIQAVYTYVVTNLTYDKERAATVTSGYLPDLDSVLAEGKGICFDYAALMTGMLRSQGIPCKLVVGYAGTAYHAWINTYSETEGWMDAVIYFDGTTWKLMDPTFASSGNSSDSIMQYIGTGSNYSAMYLY